MASEAPWELPAAVPQTQASVVEPCPRCQTPLIDAAGLGWCKACGYCRSLHNDQNNQLLHVVATGPSKAAVVAGVAGQMPDWFWLLILGIGGVAAGSLAASMKLPAGASFPRALWTSCQIAAGVLLILAGQFYALLKVAPDDDKLSFKDVLMPTRLWALVGKRISELYGCVLTSVWGVALVVCALLMVGGLNHWFSYLPNSSKNAPTQNSRK